MTDSFSDECSTNPSNPPRKEEHSPGKRTIGEYIDSVHTDQIIETTAKAQDWRATRNAIDLFISRVEIEKLKGQVDLLKRLARGDIDVNFLSKFLTSSMAKSLKALPGEPASNPSAKPEEKSPVLERRCELAYQSFECAEKQVGKQLTDREAYDWLRDEGPRDYDLPTFETWRRYVREGRKFYGTQKSSPRTGRTGRSIVTLDHITDRGDSE